MGTEDRQGTSAPDRAVLEELERLQRAIAESRQKRVDANQAYDTFMAGLDAPPPAPARPAPVAVPPVSHDSVPVPSPAPTSVSTPAQPAVHGKPAPSEGLSEFASESRPAAAAERPATPVVPSALDTPRSAPSSRTPPMVAVALVVVIVAAAAWAMMRSSEAPSPTVISEGVDRSATPPAPSPAAPVDAAAAQQAPGPAAAPVAAPPPSTAAAELTTTRRVWVRVTVDGRRALERELDANARVPLAPQQQVSIRTGDAGAVRMAIGGKDQGPLGRDGEVVTKTFTMPAPPAR